MRRLLARFRSLFTRRRDERRLSEEFEHHIDMAAEDLIRSGVSPAEARRQAILTFGGVEANKEFYRDQRMLPWLESLASDIGFGCRQLKKHRTTSAAAILSLALATGACISAFRLIDALLWRPLPVANPQQLYALSRVGIGFDGKPGSYDGWAYPSFQRMRAAVKGEAELLAVSYAERSDLTYRSDQEMEKANVQYVSGRMFQSFGLNAALGRLLTEDDDREPGNRPYAVLSNDYWARRFASDPDVIGHTFHFGDRIFEIIGVGPAGFTGTETGIVTDIFLPTMMNPLALRDDATWHRILARLRPGVAIEPVRQKLQATSRQFEEARARGFTGMSKESIARLIDQNVVLESAASGASAIQQSYRRSLLILGVLVLLVLLIACLNVANLMTARAASRAREMALRVSIGAGRLRLIQLVMVESAILAGLAVAIGWLFAWWSAPFVVSRINPLDNPVRLNLPADWRVLAFGVLLTVSVMLLFGLTPALRASAVRPASALKGGENPRGRRSAMHASIAIQVAFCFLVLFVAGLFAATFDRLSKRPLGFSAERILTLEAVAHQAQSPVVWNQVAEHLRAMPGVEALALARWPLLKGYAMNSFISVNGAPPGPVLAYFLNVSPGWIETMKIQLANGRDFRPSDTTPGSAIVNETFAKQYFEGGHPIGKFFARGRNLYEVVGVVKDAPYRRLREPILPVAYVPFQTIRADKTPEPLREAAFIIRTRAADPLGLAPALRGELTRVRPDFRVSNVRTQKELVEAQTLRERLLATVALFFAAVSGLLAGIGLYGVLDYSVLQRRREIGIRIAIGARGAGIVRLVARDNFVMVLAGAAAGFGLGLVSGHYVESLLYGVKATDVSMLAAPFLLILTLALVAALVPVLRALRVDPVAMLRAE
ncbi:MAG TPA: ABC transporter permease [Bryobacteraceae bacterium]|nr:ABC transporter permease [Bryobacteraceae bacterium]